MSFSDLFSRKAAGRHVTSEGDEEWYDDNEQLHREDDLPAQTDTHGGKAWLRHGQPHREDDKPAIEAANGDRAWYENGVLSRKTGPAVTYADKAKEAEYWLEGKPMPDDMRAAIDPAFKTALLAKNADAAAETVRNGCTRDVPLMKSPTIQRRKP
ncbi:MAG: hypothetical protein Q8K65_03000 [Alphaproteobacteria bacterium]|nr:hypothetical protein [Alphaproteobacteria bacterium]